MTSLDHLRPKCAPKIAYPAVWRAICAFPILPHSMFFILISLTIVGCGSGVTAPNQAVNPSLDDPATNVDPGGDGSNPGSEGSSSSAADPVFTATRTFCCNPLEIVFAADFGGSAIESGVRIEWTFGDGKSASGSTIQHAYSRAGRYRVVMTVVRVDGTKAAVPGVVEVGSDSGGDNVLVDPSAQGEGDQGGDGSTPQDDLVAQAGADLVVLPGAHVLLDGQASSWTGSRAPLALWSQVDGPAVSLSNADTLMASFDAPDEPGETLSFRLTLRLGAIEADDDLRILLDDGLSGQHAPHVDNASVRVAPGETVTLTLTGSDSDDDDLTFSVVTPPRQGTLGALDNSEPASAMLTYTAYETGAGDDVVEFDATDGQSDSNVGRVSIIFDDGGNHGPTAVESAAFVPVNTQARVRVSGDDPDGDILAFQIVDPPRHGRVVSIESDPPSGAIVVYAPDADYYGLDGFSFKVSDGREQSQPAKVSLTLNKLVVPWNEVNTPDDDALKYFTRDEGARDGMTVFDFAVKGIQEWGHVTNAIIITTSGSRISTLYDRFKPNLPSGMRVIGGFKTSPYLPPDDFAEPNGWLTIRDRALTTAQATGLNIVFLENETALELFNGGKVDIDLDRLQASLAPLADTGIQVWWWMPAILRDRDYWAERREHTAALVDAVVRAVPNSRFITGYTGWLNWRRGVFDEPELRDQMISMVGKDRFFDRHMVTRTGRRQRGETEDDCYTAESSLEAMPDLINDQIVIYPGASQWILTGEDYRAALPELARVAFPFK